MNAQAFLIELADRLRVGAERIGAECSDESSAVSRALETVASCIEDAAQNAQREAA